MMGSGRQIGINVGFLVGGMGHARQQAQFVSAS